jgi:exodeoxyribonuclease-3
VVSAHRGVRAVPAVGAGRSGRYGDGVRFATWNVNSLKVRLPRVEEWLSEVAPDVLCMQETKLADDAFPSLAFQALGYDSVHHGQGQWNGVAILSRVGIDDVVANFAPTSGDPDPDARIITARCGGVRFVSVYVPNGRSLDNDHYQYKLRWLAQLRRHLDAVARPDEPLVVTGDFNIAPDDRDVYDPAKFVDATHTSPAERALLGELETWGLVDVFRQQYQDDRLYSWWDYRAGDFHQGRGLRIDLVLATAAVAERAAWSVVDRNARKGTSPSDHAPVVVDLVD